MRRATIDIGSNSILLLAGNYSNGMIEEEINESRITSLGKNLDKTGVFHTESLESSFLALQEYRELLISKKYNPEDVLVTATEASRVAKNAAEFYQKVKNELGFKVQIISAEGEAYYTALGVASSLSPSSSNNIVIMDIGGASTELIKIQRSPQFKIESTISLPIGSVRATDWIAENTHLTKWEELKKKYLLKEYETEKLICVAGSMTALGAVYFNQSAFNADELDGKVISKTEFSDFLDKLKEIKPEKLLQSFPYLGKRVHSIAGGSFVAKSFVEEVVRKEIMVSTRGLRYGTFIRGAIDGIYIVG